MIDYINSNIINVSAHQVGNKTTGEDINLSEEPLDIKDNRLRELLIKYFLSHFSSPEYFSFGFSNGDFELNPVFTFVSKIFDSKGSFHKQSINLAKHLFECSLHPNIKSGDFYVAYFSDVQIEDEITDAIGLFKSETKDSFLKLTGKLGKYRLNYDDGVNIEKLDKGCLIFNTE